MATTYRGPQRAHDVHSICPFCGAHRSVFCEWSEDRNGPCPWEEGVEADAPCTATVSSEEPCDD